MRAMACCEITPVGWPIRDWISQPTPLSSYATFLHSYTLIHSVLHNFLWLRLLSFEANVSSMWFKWVLFICILGFLLYFNLGNRRVRLVALWVYLTFFIYSVYLFFNIHFNSPLVRFLSLVEAGGVEWMDHKGAKISASAHSKLSPQRGFQSYTSSQRDPLNLARLYNTASPIIVCLLFLSCEITVKYLCKCFHATLERVYEMTADGLSLKVITSYFYPLFHKATTMKCQTLGVSCILNMNFDSWGCWFDWWIEIMLRPATCVFRKGPLYDVKVMDARCVLMARMVFWKW